MSLLRYYHTEGSPPCRSVRMLARVLDLELELVDVDLVEGAHLKPEYVKMNPQHQVPVLDDDGFYLAESRAILGYLVDKYAKDDSLYPRDPKKRAVVNRMLYFDLGTLWMAYYQYQLPVYYGQAGDPEKKKKLLEALEMLDKLLDGKEWAGGDHMTIADISLAVTVTTAQFVGFDMNPYSNITRWLNAAAKAIPGFEEINSSSFAALKLLLEAVNEKLGKQKTK